MFATVPLDRGGWRPLVFTTLCAYKNGIEVFRGTNHGSEYIQTPQDMKFLFTDYSGL
jgi:hypothetical protein